MTTPPRYAPGQPLPPYAFVPGHNPHPKRDPQGHMHGVPEPTPPPMDPDDPMASEAFLFGVDLFNRGFYWESHVWWEGLWHAHGRRGDMADLLKGLIRLAAAGVKAKGGKATGLREHALAAAGLFRGLAQRHHQLAGIGLKRLAAVGEEAAARADALAKRGAQRAAALEIALTIPPAPLRGRKEAT